jgi:hypothetical protein
LFKKIQSGKYKFPDICIDPTGKKYLGEFPDIKDPMIVKDLLADVLHPNESLRITA